MKAFSSHPPAAENFAFEPKGSSKAFGGSISASRDSAVAVPTHANTDYPLSGAVLEAMRRKHGINFDSHEPILVPEHGLGTYRIKECGKFPGEAIFLVRIPGIYMAAQRSEDPLLTFRHALWTLFGSLAAMEVRGEKTSSLAMPLLAATRGYSTPEIMRIILETSLDWLRASRCMKAINLYLIDPEMVETWTDAMDEVLGRRFIDSAQNAMVNALREEIVVRLASGGDAGSSKHLLTCAERLSATLENQKIPLERIAAEARGFVECVVVGMLKTDGVVDPKGTLETRISELRRRNKVAPWILAHFDCLRVFGNAAVHFGEQVSYHPPQLREEDLIPILAALQRVVAFAQATGANTGMTQ